jgi:hypothetical protein
MSISPYFPGGSLEHRAGGCVADQSDFTAVQAAEVADKARQAQVRTPFLRCKNKGMVAECGPMPIRCALVH